MTDTNKSTETKLDTERAAGTPELIDGGYQAVDQMLPQKVTLNQMSINQNAPKQVSGPPAKVNSEIALAKTPKDWKRPVFIAVFILSFAIFILSSVWYVNLPRHNSTALSSGVGVLMAALGADDLSYPTSLVDWLAQGYFGAGMTPVAISRENNWLKICENKYKYGTAQEYPMAYATLAMAQTVHGDLARARLYYEMLLRQYPKSLYVHWQLAHILALNGDFKSAVEEIDRGFAKSDPKDDHADQAAVAKGELLLAMGEYDKAVRWLTSERPHYQTTANANDLPLTLANVYLEMGEPERVIEMATKMNGLFWQSRVCRAHLELGQMDLAMHVIRGMPTGWLSLDKMISKRISQVSMSFYYCKKGELEKAERYAQDAVTSSVVGQTPAWTYEQLAFVQIKLKKFDQALSSVNLGLKNPLVAPADWLALHTDKAAAFFGLGRSQEALDEARLVISINPRCRLALQIAEKACLKRGELLNAKNYHQQLSELPVLRSYR